MSKISPRPNHPITRSPDRPIRQPLLRWFDREKRSLPWRGVSDPYRVWVSEVMLQQTTVAAVRGRYERFLRRFPTLRSLSRASQDQVLAAWSGLGYYGRARNLRRAARQVVSELGGRLPRDPAALSRLPGFGPYTAAAVASIAYGVPAAAADANVTRVVSRLFALRGVAGSSTHRRAVLQRISKLMPRGRPGDFTAALMDLGQLVCTPRKPACPRCPLWRSCAARRLRQPERFPRRRRRPPAAAAYLAAADARRAGRALLVRRADSLLSGMWRHPFGEGSTPAAARRRLEAELASAGLVLRSRAPSSHARHTMVNRRLAIAVYPALPNPKRVRRSPGEGGPKIQNPNSARWFRPSDLARAAVPTLTRKIAAAAGFLRR